MCVRPPGYMQLYLTKKCFINCLWLPLCAQAAMQCLCFCVRRQAAARRVAALRKRPSTLRVASVHKREREEILKTFSSFAVRLRCRPGRCKPGRVDCEQLVMNRFAYKLQHALRRSCPQYSFLGRNCVLLYHQVQSDERTLQGGPRGVSLDPKPIQKSRSHPFRSSSI